MWNVSYDLWQYAFILFLPRLSEYSELIKPFAIYLSSFFIFSLTLFLFVNYILCSSVLAQATHSSLSGSCECSTKCTLWFRFLFLCLFAETELFLGQNSLPSTLLHFQLFLQRACVGTSSASQNTLWPHLNRSGLLWEILKISCVFYYFSNSRFFSFSPFYLRLAPNNWCDFCMVNQLQVWCT